MEFHDGQRYHRGTTKRLTVGDTLNVVREQDKVLQECSDPWDVIPRNQCILARYGTDDYQTSVDGVTWQDAEITLDLWLSLPFEDASLWISEVLATGNGHFESELYQTLEKVMAVLEFTRNASSTPEVASPATNEA